MKILKTLFPHLVAIIIFLIITFAMSSPVLEGKKIKTTDFEIWRAVSYENTNYFNETGEIPLWCNNMFSGMPDYTVSAPKKENIFQKIYMSFIFYNYTIGVIFWYLLGFYILLVAFKIKPWLAIAGAIAFAFSSYFFVIMLAGHFTKAAAIAYMAPTFAGVYIAFERKKIIIGTLITTLFLTLQYITGHVQILYYTAIIVAIYGLGELIFAIIKKQILTFLKTFAILLIAPIFALTINAAVLLTTMEYTKYSMRGGSELTTAQHNRTSGLDIDYATSWSYGIDETFTLLIPNFKGASSHFDIGKNTESYKFLNNYFGKNAEQITKYFPAYFGDQQFTLGTVYVGAIVCFLFILGIFVVKHRIKWILLALTLISIVLAWGSNFQFFTNILMHYVPGYNKFRALSMILVIAEFTMPLLGILAINEILKKTIPLEKMKIFFFVSFAAVALPILVFLAIPTISGSDKECVSELQLADQLASYMPKQVDTEKFKSEFLATVYQDRTDLVRNSALRSLLFLVIGAGILYFFMVKKSNENVLIPAIAFSVIFMADLIPISRNYFNKDIFEKEKKNAEIYLKSTADEYILQDKSHYRVLNLSVSPFNDGSTSYRHKSIGGYSGAKMRRYQDLCDTMFMKSTGEWSHIQSIIYMAQQNGLNQQQLQMLFSQRANIPALSMLNTKYIIFNKDYPPLENTHRLGNAWFVNSYKIVNTADDEIISLKTFNPKNEAIINRQFENFIKGINLLERDSIATIKLTAISPNKAEYEYQSETDQLAVFSEIYYPKGWKVKIDDQETGHFRANYVLRAMKLPAGNHKIFFSFEPESYKIGVKISYIAVTLFFLMIIAVIGFYGYKLKKGNGNVK